MNSFQPHITVATVVERDGRLLFVRERIDDRVVINQPAGHVEAGERLEQAAFRETLEETGWTVEITALLGLYVFQPRAGSGIFYRCCFIGEALGQDPAQRLDDGILEAVWLPPNDIREPSAPLRSPLVRRCMEDYLGGRRLPLDAIYEHPWPLQVS